jgi:hypothetical protein
MVVVVVHDPGEAAHCDDCGGRSAVHQLVAVVMTPP